MSLCRVVIDLEFTVDDGEFKAAGLTAEPSGVEDVSASAVRHAISRMLMQVDWQSIGMSPLRSLVLSRSMDSGGWYEAVHLVGDRGVGEPAA